MTEKTTPPYLILGEILRPHGIRGEIRLRVLTDYPERLPLLKKVFLGTDATKARAKSIELEAVRLHQEDYALLKFVGIDTRNDAELLRGQFVMIDFENAVPLEEDEYYTFQLIGLTVITEAGHIIGKIREVLETGANDVIVVDSPEYGEVLIPDIESVWVNFDFEGGFATVNLPDGLLPS